MTTRPPAPKLPPAAPGDRVLPDSPPRWLEVLIMLAPVPVAVALLWLGVIALQRWCG